MLLLLVYNITPSLAKKIYKLTGSKLIRNMELHPLKNQIDLLWSLRSTTDLAWIACVVRFYILFVPIFKINYSHHHDLNRLIWCSFCSKCLFCYGNSWRVIFTTKYCFMITLNKFLFSVIVKNCKTYLKKIMDFQNFIFNEFIWSFLLPFH